VPIEGWASVKNGELLALIGEAGFSAFISADKNLDTQQSLRGRPFATLLLRACNKTPTERQQLRHLLLIGDLHMACVLVPDALWNLIEPLLPIPSPKPQGGRPRLADRACLAGVIFVLRSGIPWRMLPKALGCGSGMTCWRRLRDWQQGRNLGFDPFRIAGLSFP
jgi:hypothetical protein